MNRYLPAFIGALMSLAPTISHALHVELHTSPNDHGLRIDVEVKNAPSIKRAELVLKFDPKTLRVKDADNYTSGTQISLPAALEKAQVEKNIVDLEHRRIRLILNNNPKRHELKGDFTLASLQLIGKTNAVTDIKLIRGKFRDEFGGDEIAPRLGLRLQTNTDGAVTVIATDEQRRKRAMPFVLGAVILLVVIGWVIRKRNGHSSWIG